MRSCYALLKWARHPILCALALLACSVAFAQNEILVKGTVQSDTAVLEGVTVSVKSNPAKATRTDSKGNYTIQVPANGTLVFSFVTYKTMEYDVKGENVLNVVLKADDKSMDEVAVVAYGRQKKSSLTGAVTTINPRELKGPTSNLTTMLAGRVAGLISYQRSGEPGADNAQFFIRGVTSFGSGKKDPLILIDGIESSNTDVARLQPDDLASVSFLKDAAAASLYGARGANGVLLITTRLGVEGKTTFYVRLENSLSSNTQNYKFADNITYMQLANEAERMRNDNPIEPYSRNKIDHTAAGDDPLLYPSNDWMGQMVKDYTNNQRLNMNIKGGGKVARYYISGTYNVDNGVLKENQQNNFKNNIKLRSYAVRSTVDITLTPTTQAIIRTYGQFDDYHGPIGGGSNYFNQALQANPVLFPAIYPQSYAPGIKHPLFGNAKIGSGTGYSYINPYANLVSGYQEKSAANLNVQLDINQNLSFITQGLSARMMTYTDRSSAFDVSRSYFPFYYKLDFAPGTKEPVLTSLNTGQEYLNYVPGSKTLYTNNYFEAQISYNRKFGNHGVSASAITLLQSKLNGNEVDLQKSLPYRNQGISGRLAYDYSNRYRLEFDFGYNGSERFHESHRFGFFPAISGAWNVYNEKWFESLAGTFNLIRLRGSYGLVGNDQIGSDNDRFFYLSNVNMNDEKKGAVFGESFGYGQNGVTVTRYENPDISWEIGHKANIGLELGLWNALNITIDAWRERRTNILMDRPTIPNTMGLSAGVRANVGEAVSRGIDVQLDYNKNFNKHTFLAVQGTFTYAASKLKQAEEPAYNEWYRSRVGYSLSQHWGLVAERLFIDDAEVANSPVQQWGLIRAGDIKYRDVNGDGHIDGDGDQVPIGFPEQPEINYGFGLSFGHKGFVLSAFFSGSARSSIFIDNNSIQPFRMHDGFQNGLLKVIADDHWSEDNRNIYAFWPRLSSNTVTNNQWGSTWWMRNGAYLRLKTVELAYNLPVNMVKKLHLKSSRIYVNASNLFVISGFDMWDPEMGGNGLGYPLQKVINAGFTIEF